ncbi:hypothetical protein WDW89_10140 [Deltaproteobacteria bacterium TL4]
MKLKISFIMLSFLIVTVLFGWGCEPNTDSTSNNSTPAVAPASEQLASLAISIQIPNSALSRSKGVAADVSQITIMSREAQ